MIRPTCDEKETRGCAFFARDGRYFPIHNKFDICDSFVNVLWRVLVVYREKG
jgi:hypothetical protein